MPCAALASHARRIGPGLDSARFDPIRLDLGTRTALVPKCRGPFNDSAAPATPSHQAPLSSRLQPQPKGCRRQEQW
jgi:hypothetical protein